MADSSDSRSFAETGSIGMRAEHLVRRYGWAVPAGLATIFLILLVIFIAASQPRLLGDPPGIVGAAAVLGASIAFTGILVPCVILLISRLNAFTAVTDDATDVAGQIERGKTHALAIQQHERKSEARDW